MRAAPYGSQRPSRVRFGEPYPSPQEVSEFRGRRRVGDVAEYRVRPQPPRYVAQWTEHEPKNSGEVSPAGLYVVGGMAVAAVLLGVAVVLTSRKEPK